MYKANKLDSKSKNNQKKLKNFCLLCASQSNKKMIKPRRKKVERKIIIN